MPLCEHLRRNRNYPQRAPRTVDDLERRCNHKRAGGGQLIQVHQAGEAKPARAVHESMTGERRIEAARLAGIGAYGLYTDAEDVALFRQVLRAGGVKARRVRATVPDIQKLLAALAFAPTAAN